VVAPEFCVGRGSASANRSGGGCAVSGSWPRVPPLDHGQPKEVDRPGLADRFRRLTAATPPAVHAGNDWRRCAVIARKEATHERNGFEAIRGMLRHPQRPLHPASDREFKDAIDTPEKALRGGDSVWSRQETEGADGGLAIAAFAASGQGSSRRTLIVPDRTAVTMGMKTEDAVKVIRARPAAGHALQMAAQSAA